MNVLLTSVGRRAYMVKYFKKAVGKGGQVHVCNSDDLTVAFQYADKSIISPLIYDDNYIPFLLNYCRENKIDILLSLFDIDLLVLAKNRDRFKEIGTTVIVSDTKFIEICNDKWKSYQYLKDNGFNVPKTFLSLEETLTALKTGEMTFPIIVKPRFGCGSISITVAYDEDDLKYLIKKVQREVETSYLRFESAVVAEKIIYQEYLSGQEYGADIINNLKGELQNIIVRKKLAMRSGETDIAELVEEPVIEHELMKLGKITKHIANLDCDIFLVKGIPYILEMNARFGGGYPFSHMGGCDLPQAIIGWFIGKSLKKETLQAQIGIRGYKELVITKEYSD
ncbi:MAG: ATP-grasp domain-containing protein [Candidatus Scatosoma sp.]